MRYQTHICSEFVTNCTECNIEDGVFRCLQCAFGFLDKTADRHDSRTLRVDLEIEGFCETCTIHDKHCVECTKEKCTKCQVGYYWNQIDGSCDRCLYDYLCEEENSVVKSEADYQLPAGTYVKLPEEYQGERVVDRYDEVEEQREREYLK